jgi:hypothetical protein
MDVAKLANFSLCLPPFAQFFDPAQIINVYPVTPGSIQLAPPRLLHEEIIVLLFTTRTRSTNLSKTINTVNLSNYRLTRYRLGQ